MDGSGLPDPSGELGASKGATLESGPSLSGAGSMKGAPGGAKAGPGPRSSKDPSDQSGLLKEPQARSGPVVVSVQRLWKPKNVAKTEVFANVPSLNTSAALSVGTLEVDGEMADCDTSTISLASTARRKRTKGWPPTNGEYVGLAAAKKAAIEAEKEELALRTLKVRLEGTGSSTSRDTPREWRIWLKRQDTSLQRT